MSHPEPSDPLHHFCNPSASFCVLLWWITPATFCRGLPQAVGSALPSLLESQKCLRTNDQLGRESENSVLLSQVRARPKVSLNIPELPEGSGWDWAWNHSFAWPLSAAYTPSPVFPWSIPLINDMQAQYHLRVSFWKTCPKTPPLKNHIPSFPLGL